MEQQANLFDYKRQEKVRFNGPAYNPHYDDKRLTGQLHRIFELMSDGVGRTLDEIAVRTGDPPASISANLRHLRKKRFGSHTVSRKIRGDRTRGLWEYQLIPSLS